MTIALSQVMQPYLPIVLSGPVHPKQVSWHGTQTPSRLYLLSGQCATQNLPFLTFMHVEQLSALGPVQECLHSE